MKAYSTLEIFDGSYNNNLVLSTNDDKCQQVISDILGAQCYYGNGFIKQINDDEDKVQRGQGQTDLIKLFSGSTNSYFYSWDLIKPNNDSKYGLKLKSTIEQFNTLGFQGGQCQNLNGQWFGKAFYSYHIQYLLSDDIQDSNVIYDIIVNIESTPRNVQFTYQSIDFNQSGNVNVFDNEVNDVLFVSCDSNQSIFSKEENSAAGKFTEDYIALDYPFEQQDSKQTFRSFVLFRDEN